MFRRPALLLAGALALVCPSSALRAGEPAAQVFINGKPSAVYFNDGDSFRVLKGKYRGTKARLAGFNTLESHGPVHQWGSWHRKELYHLAKMATLHARNGVWHCETDGETDTYGRMLLWCPDLAEAQIRKGFAHAMTVTDDPADKKLLAAQREAIAAKRGIWAHGVPELILTSLHSVEEDVSGRGTYNRLVSSTDGHSIKWKHQNRYEECSRICLRSYSPSADVLPQIVARLQKDAPDLASELDAAALAKVVETYQRLRLVDRPVPADQRSSVAKLLAGYASEGALGEQQEEGEVSCMIHVAFKRRYGTGRAECLK